MKRNRNLSLLVFVFFLVIIFVTFSVISVEARNNRIKKSKPHHKHQKDKSGNGNTSNLPGPAPAPLPHYGSNQTPSTIFDVLAFGAKGDGVSDDSKVKQMQRSWLCVCAWMCKFEFELWNVVLVLRISKLQAFLSAWKAACAVTGATVKFPSEFKFLLKPITLQGPCMPSLFLQVKFFFIFIES